MKINYKKMISLDKDRLNQKWWILVRQKKEGPYTKSELGRHPFFNPETLVWKEGFDEWIKAKYVPELLDLFPKEMQDIRPGSLILTMDKDPYQKIIWVLLFLFALFYVFLFTKTLR